LSGIEGFHCAEDKKGTRAVSPTAYLEFLGARNVAHSGRYLFHHLFRTWQILVAWEVAEHICLGGLYHSVYGTNRFEHSIAGTTDRQAIAVVIGSRAEQLAYLFSQIEPTSFFGQALSAAQKRCVAHCSLGGSTVVQPEEISGLAIIECGNLYEQGLWPSNAASLLACVRLCGARKFPLCQYN
jgi:hypothetical protein